MGDGRVEFLSNLGLSYTYSEQGCKGILCDVIADGLLAWILARLGFFYLHEWNRSRLFLSIFSCISIFLYFFLLLIANVYFSPKTMESSYLDRVKIELNIYGRISNPC